MPKRKYHRKVYQHHKWLGPVVFILKVLGGFLILGALGGAFLFVYFARDLPQPEKFTERQLVQSTKIYDRSGEILLYQMHGSEKRTAVSLKEIPDYVQKAVIAAEDGGFYNHPGIDVGGIARAILADIRLLRPAQGGSTIPQQLIRSTFLTREKTIKRKTREIILALELDRRYSKTQILEWYLNQVPFGGNAYGIEAASQTYFGKPASGLSLEEGATLAAMVRAPTYFSPYGKHQEELLARKDRILKRMADLKFISLKQAHQAQQREIGFKEPISSIKAPHFTLNVRKQLIEKYGEKFLEKKGLRIYTSLDWDLQQKAQKIIKQGVEKNKAFNAYNASLVAIDPHTGHILALVGSANWFASDSYPSQCSIEDKTCLFDPKFNVAVSGKRQPGSAFKPFAYAEAFGQGFTPDTMLWDVKTEFNLSCPPDGSQEKTEEGNKCYHPQNYDQKFRGPVSFTQALAQSINLPSVKVLYLAGIKDTINLAQKMGITTLTQPERYGLSLVLGGGEVKLLDMTSAYGVFATQGLKVSPISVVKIEDTQGNIVFQEKKDPKRVLSSSVAKLVNSILSDNQARAPMFGSQSPLLLEGQPAAAKTGTTQNSRDAWTVGYSPSIAVGVWAGNNNNAPTSKPGVTLAAPLWHDFMEEALKKYPPKRDFEKPQPILVDKPVLKGKIGDHSILHYVNPSQPQGSLPQNFDPQYPHWEYGIKE